MKRILLALAVMAGSIQAQEETASVSGKVHINAAVKPPKKIGMVPACAALHPVPPRSEGTVVDDQNNVKWAFVWIKKGLEGKTFPVPSGAVLLDQVGCTYTPHVFGIRVGQTLKIRNSDEMLHNVHGLPFSNKEFNYGQPAKGLVNETKFTAPEVMVFVKCDIHDWMRSWAGVLEHPFFAVTDASGDFAIKGLPPGKYTVRVWQEEWTTVAEKDLEQEIVVKAGGKASLTFQLDKKKE